MFSNSRSGRSDREEGDRIRPRNIMYHISIPRTEKVREMYEFKFSLIFKNFSPVMGTENSVTYSSDVATGSHPEPDDIRSTSSQPVCVNSYWCGLHNESIQLLESAQQIKACLCFGRWLGLPQTRKWGPRTPLLHSQLPRVCGSRVLYRHPKHATCIVKTASWVCRHTGTRKNGTHLQCTCVTASASITAPLLAERKLWCWASLTYIQTTLGGSLPANKVMWWVTRSGK